MMSLDSIPWGARVPVDTNALIYAKLSKSTQYHRLLESCLRRKIVGFIRPIVSAEFCHRRMIQEAQAKTLVDSNPKKSLVMNPAPIRRLNLNQQDLENLLAGELQVMASDTRNFAKNIEIQRARALPTNQRLNLEMAFQNMKTMLATVATRHDSNRGITILMRDDL